jgi:hypothetical protein
LKKGLRKWLAKPWVICSGLRWKRSVFLLLLLFMEKNAEKKASKTMGRERAGPKTRNPEP